MINIIKKIWRKKPIKSNHFLSKEDFNALRQKRNIKTLKDFIEEDEEMKRKEIIKKYKNKFS